MYLSDRDLKQLLPELCFSTAHPSHPFDPAGQIQPCSIDLRLDNVFWRQRWGQRIDLSRRGLLEEQPRRHWEKRRLSDGQAITLRPREMILGRTYESFRIPAGHAGKLEGRSTFSRMGLAIHCSADFINPGYGGHMPLQLINLGTHTIKVYPYLSVCQLIVVKLSSDSDRLYGHDDLHSKYVNDDGGPSFWWRDKQIAALQVALGNRSVPDEIQAELLQFIGAREPEVMERLERFIAKLPLNSFDNTHDLLDKFAQAENWSSKVAFLKRPGLFWLVCALVSTSIAALARLPYGVGHYWLWGITAPLAIFAAWYFLWGDIPGEFLDQKELEKIRREQ